MKISWQYPVVELLTAVTTAVIWFSFPVQSPIVKLLDSLIAYCFIVIFFSDWIYSLIPDEMIAIGSFATAIYNLQFTIYNQFLISNFKFQISNLGQNLLVGILSGLGFLLVVVATRFKGMGLGDVKLAFLMGFLLGWPNVLIAFWAAFIIGGMVAIFLLLLKKVQFSDRIALGPYLVFGTVISALWSKEVWHLLGF